MFVVDFFYVGPVNTCKASVEKNGRNRRKETQNKAFAYTPLLFFLHFASRLFVAHTLNLKCFSFCIAASLKAVQRSKKLPHRFCFFIFFYFCSALLQAAAQHLIPFFLFAWIVKVSVFLDFNTYSKHTMRHGFKRNVEDSIISSA